MAFTISIDRLDANIEEITIGKWLKQEGDEIEIGEPVVEIISDKITFEYESEAAGVLRRIVSPEKSIVPVHYIIGVIADLDEPLPGFETTNSELMASLKASAAGASPPSSARSGGSRSVGERRVRATPAARRRAKELGLDLEVVAADIEGAVSVEDVERFAEQG